MDLIQKYFPDLSDNQLHKFSLLGELYNDWNQKINLVSRKDIPHLYERHILHSLSIAKFFHFENGTKIMDVGTGGGFPGIPLSILFPEAHFHLVDSIGKKIKVVNSIIEKIELKNSSAEHARAEKVKGKFNIIVSRAVTNFSDFVKLTRSKLIPGKIKGFTNGIIYLKGGDFQEEIQPFKDKVTIYSISDIFEEKFFETKKIIYLRIN
ncbi:MAG: 16S rRNA (guanine(527)-N(7))-methyltransferase RsmG [Bacteroidales bacterium]